MYGDADTDPVTVSLRKELYPTDTAYESINWSNARHKVADIDNYSPVSTVMKFAPSIKLNATDAPNRLQILSRYFAALNTSMQYEV